MEVWKVALIAVAVLSLAYGAANYRAVANELDELQQRLTLTEGVLEGKVGDIRVLQATLDDKILQIGQLEVSEAGLKEQLGALQVQHATLLQEKAELDGTVLGLKTLSLDLQEKLASKGKEYDALQGTYAGLSTSYKGLQGDYATLSSAVGTLEGVKSQVSGLQLVVYSLKRGYRTVASCKSSPNCGVL